MDKGDEAHGGELRRNPVNGKLSIVAPARATRPRGARQATRSARRPPVARAEPRRRPATARSARATRASRRRRWTRSGPAAAHPTRRAGRRVPSPTSTRALRGRHEVIVHSPRHDVELEDLGDDELVEALELWRRRIAWQLADGAAAATLIVNRGAVAGASQPHPHAQLFATPVVPPLLLDELAEFDALPQPLRRAASSARSSRAPATGLVHDGDVAAWVPAALRFSHELWLAPREHQPDVREADLRPLAHDPAPRPRRARRGDRRRAPELLAAHGPGRAARPVPLAPRAGAAPLHPGRLRAGHGHRPGGDGPGGRRRRPARAPGRGTDARRVRRTALRPPVPSVWSASWPQAASISAPGERRSVQLTPAASSRALNGGEPGGRRPPELAARLVVRDQVQVVVRRPHPRRQHLRLLVGVVDAVEHHVLEEHLAARAPHVPRARARRPRRAGTCG